MSDLKELADIIARYAERDGVHETAVPRLSIVRISKPSEPVHGVHKAAICLVAQGRKQLIVGDEVFRYEPSQQLLVSVDLPLIGQVIEASADEPYLSMKLELDFNICTEMLLKLPPAPAETDFGLSISKASPELFDAMVRLLKLHETPGDVAELAPLIEREIIYRLLGGPCGGMLRQLAAGDSRLAQVRRAIGWIRDNLAEPFHVEELAAHAGMSASAFHRHFKAVTAMSPIQYQKRLRLHVARRRLIAEAGDVAHVAFSVGYESATQFSREYARMFGAPPAKDGARLRRLDAEDTGEMAEVA